MEKDSISVNSQPAAEPEVRKLDLPEGVPPLSTFYLYIANGCNLACRHCWITPAFADGKPSPGDCLDLDLLKLAVREGKSLGLRSAKLTGGEPVLHPRFIEIVDFLSAENIKLTMETNGTLIDANLARHLKNDSSMWFLSTSLDSASPDAHDRFRGVPGSFHAALRGIGHLVHAGFRPQVIMCPHRGNLHEVEDLVSLAVSLGAGSVKFNPVTSTGRGQDMDRRGETLQYDEILNLARHVRGELQARTPIPLYISIPPALSSIHEILRLGCAGGECRVLNILGILGNGEMALCGIGRNIPELCFGRLGEEDLRDVWLRHPVLLKLRQDLKGPFPGICDDCVHARRCLTLCVAMNYVRCGELIHPDALCAEAERRGAFPVTRRRSLPQRA